MKGQAIIGYLVTGFFSIAVTAVVGWIGLGTNVAAQGQALKDQDRRVNVLETSLKDMDKKLDSLLFTNPLAIQRYNLLAATTTKDGN